MSRIRSVEEYDEKKNRLNELVDRYKWLIGSKDPIRDLKSEQEIYVLKYSDRNLTPEEALKIESALQKIGVQSMYINGRGASEYEAVLMQEIQSLASDICEYEADKRLSEKTPFEIIKDVINGNKTTKEDLKYKRSYAYGEDIGYIGTRRNIELTPPEIILERMAKQIDWAKLELITDEEKKAAEERQNEELSLVLSQNEKTNKMLESLQQQVQEKIKNLGLNDITRENDDTSKNSEKDEPALVDKPRDFDRKNKEEIKSEKESVEEEIKLGKNDGEDVER